MPNLDSLNKTKSSFISLVIYFLFTIGVSLQIGGSNWDVVWHGSKNVESFLTPPHAVIYSGVGLTIGNLMLGLAIYGESIKNKYNKKILFPFIDIFKKNSLIPFAFKVVFLGTILQVTAGPFDFMWHNTFGFDGLLSPPHTILVFGMFFVSIGAMIGIFNYLKFSLPSKFELSTTIIPRVLFLVSCGVALMVAIDIVFLFTLPFSEGQYFNFNPDPFSAIFVAIISMPFIISTFLVSISSSLKIPFTFTSIASVIILIQSTATIVSNSYFAGIFSYYLLNILPALILDIILLKTENFTNQSNYNGFKDRLKKRYVIASIVFSLFFIPLFFPWSVDVFGGFFQPSNDTRTEQFLLQILYPIILPIVIPISLVSSYCGAMFSTKFMKDFIKR